MTATATSTRRPRRGAPPASALLYRQPFAAPSLSPAGTHLAYLRRSGARRVVTVRALAQGDVVAAHDLGAEPAGRLAWVGDSVVAHVRRAASDAVVVVGVDGEAREHDLRARLRQPLWSVGDVMTLHLVDRTGCRLERLGLDGSAAAPRTPLPPGAWHVFRDERTVLRKGDGRVELGTIAGRRWTLRFALDEIEAADLAVPAAANQTPRTYLLSSHAAPARRLVWFPPDAADPVEVASTAPYDITCHPIGGAGVWFSPLTGEADLVTYMDDRLRWIAVGNGDDARLGVLHGASDHDRLLIGRSRDDSRWLVERIFSDRPVDYVVVDHEWGETELVLETRPRLRSAPLRRLEPFSVAANDGHTLRGYLMRPAGRPPYPTMVVVHSGPAIRDMWRFDTRSQWLATRGVMSLLVNYRGSFGYGRAFRELGYGEWGGAIQDDLLTGLRHATAAGLADPERVGMMGMSFGGYCALVAAATHPHLLRCCVAMSAPADLVELAYSPPLYWKPLRRLLWRHLGAERAPDDASFAELLASRSPLSAAGGWGVPTLLAHGSEDKQTPVDSLLRFAERARATGSPVECLVFEGESHSLDSPSTIDRLYGALEPFIERHLLDKGDVR
jgi:dipeptidyl aminopeptidase/acylaminoacyl peptidase